MALLSIVLPSYNEEQNIANTAKVLSELLEQEKIEYELVFVSDGSKDGTAKLVQETFRLNQVYRPIRKQVKCKDQIAIYEGKSEKGIPITLIDKNNGGKHYSQKTYS